MARNVVQSKVALEALKKARTELIECSQKFDKVLTDIVNLSDEDRNWLTDEFEKWEKDQPWYKEQ